MVQDLGVAVDAEGVVEREVEPALVASKFFNREDCRRRTPSSR